MGNVPDVEKVVTRMRLSRPLSRGAVMTACAAGAVGVAGVVFAAVHLGSSSPTSSPVSPSTATGTVVDGQTQVAVVGLRNGRVPWNKPVTVSITNGKLRTVSISADGSGSIDGTLSSGDTVWTSAETLVPLARYHANVSFDDSGSHTKTMVVNFKAADTTKHLK